MEKFNFTYSAKEQEELKKIRQKYTQQEDKMSKVRKLDQQVTNKATTNALVIGIIGAIIMGIGMSLAMTDMATTIGLTMTMGIICGIIIGLIGIVLVSMAYPIYKRTIKVERAKIAQEIIELTDELMK